MNARQADRARLRAERQSTLWAELLGCAGDGHGKYAAAAAQLKQEQAERKRGLAFAKAWRAKNRPRAAPGTFPFPDHRTVKEVDHG